MNEKYIERTFVKKVKKENGMALKFVSPGASGVPDRIVLMPKGKIAFAELKAPGKKMRPVQISMKRKLESLGFQVYLVDSLDKIDEVISEVMKDEI